MKKDGRKEFCKVCSRTTMLRRTFLSPASNIALWVYFILGLVLIGRLKTVDIFASMEPLIRIIYIGSIIIFAAYDSFIKTLEYRCKICGLNERMTEERSSRAVQLIIIATTLFFILLLVAVFAFLIYTYVSI